MFARRPPPEARYVHISGDDGADCSTRPAGCGTLRRPAAPATANPDYVIRPIWIFAAAASVFTLVEDVRVKRLAVLRGAQSP
jgi:hypothetical protein